MVPGNRDDSILGSAAFRLTGTSDHFGFLAEDDVDLPVGTDLGGVTIVRPIAAGGMGRVYEAVQTAPQRSVAVKVIRGGLVSTAALRRFEHEANLLARLQHPHIAQIHALGTFVRDGLTAPFFVMELVADALPITQYATEQGLSVRDRVHLFRPVCAAVFHGHLSGVI
ncbi:MAG: protein kinase, partial [Planctomycetota bacterium]